MRPGIIRFMRRAGDISDDTQLTICVARSIDKGVYSHESFLRELAYWSRIRVGAGRACSRAAFRARNGNHSHGENSEGNGAAIRVVPLAIATSRKPVAKLVALVTRNALATHNTLAATGAAIAVAVLVREALCRPMNAFDDGSELRRAIEVAMVVSAFDLRLPREPIKTDSELHSNLSAAGTSGHVYQSVSAAFLMLLRYRLDFDSAMRAIFFAGGDTDSIGAIVGSIIGAQLGIKKLPSEWVERVQHRDYLCHLADQLSWTR